MKTIVVVDSNGFIGATVPPSVKPEGEDAPRGAKMIPGAGQIAHVLDIPSDVSRLGTTELYRAYRVNLRGKPRLVKFEPAPPREKPPGEPPAKK